MADPQHSLYFTRDETRQEFSDELKFTGQHAREIDPNIFLSEGTSNGRLYWALDYWPVHKMNFLSVSDAAKQLRQLSKFWSYAGGANFRRGQLIAEALKVKKAGELTFPVPGGTPARAAFTLADKDALWYTQTPLKGNFAGGKIRFKEDKSGPPSRAYLKLYEALTLTGILPSSRDHVLDLGATPGGWSYVAASLGARVTMVDRSEPERSLFRKFSGLEYVKGDGLNPNQGTLEVATYILSDMACEPAKLLPAVRRWLELKNLRAMVCTLKFHGLSDKRVIREFASIPGSEVYHLWYNGHELTWVWSANR
jgi:23S rRNA (cytidine2498-2'-O)-methyltransferase